MIVADIYRAVGQLGDPRFRRVLLLGLGLTIALLIAFAYATMQLTAWFFPDTVVLPWFGEVRFLESVAEGLSLLAVLGLSVFLMVPVASAFTGIFLDDVADAVEARHYPHLDAAPSPPFLTTLVDTLSFLGVIILANILALSLYLLFPPFAPVIFWGMNGYLLGREFFQLAAMRREGRDGARALRKRHMGKIWLAGGLMALPLTIPILNLLVPIVGAATFTHLYHRLARTRRPAASGP